VSFEGVLGVGSLILGWEMGFISFCRGMILELNGLKLPVFGCNWIKLVYLVCFCARNMGYLVLFLILE